MSADDQRSDDEQPESTAGAWDGMLREAFGGGPPVDGAESVVAAIERIHDARADVLLRDAPGTHSPIVRVVPSEQSELTSDPRYHILGEIARGGIGVVYKARDNDLGRDVAIKVLRPDHAERPGLIERFVEEAQVAGQLQHPGIVPVYGLGLQADGRPQFAMKLVKGDTLAAVMEQRKSPADARRRLLGIFEQICQAMAYAHAKGVIHRDLKPANVMIGPFGEVLVVDWGLAKVLGRPSIRKPVDPQASIIATVRSDADGSQSQDGSVMGTPAYMPPEQALGQVDDLDERSDVFALGAILTEILTGDPPYTGDGREAFLQAVRARLDDAHERLAKCGADAHLLDLVKRCLAESPRDRPRDAAAVAKAIGTYLEQAEERAHRARVAEAKAAAVEAEHRAREARAQLQTERENAAEAEAKRKTEAEDARRKSELLRSRAAKKTRNLTMATAAVAIVGVLGTGWFLQSRSAERAAQRRGLEGSVASALREAARLEGEGKWSEALEVAKSARDIAAAGPVESQEQASALVVRVAAAKDLAARAADQAATDHALVERIHELHTQFTQGGDHRRTTAAQLNAILIENGVPPETADPAAAAAAMDSRAPEVIEALGNALALIAIAAPPGSTKRRRALAIENALDPDPWRVELRAAWESGDRPRQRALVRSPQFSAQPFIVRRRAANRVTVRAAGSAPESEDLELGLVLLDRLAHERPQDAKVHAELWRTHWWSDDRSHADVLGSATAVVALRPASVSARANLAWFERVLGDLRRAVDGFHAAEGLGGNSLTTSSLPLVLVESGDEAAGAAFIDQLDDADDLDALRARAVWLMITKRDYRGALQILERVVRESPDDFWATTSRIGCLNQLASPAAALEVSTPAAERWPTSSEILRVHAFAVARVGRYDEALELFRRAHAMDPKIRELATQIIDTHLKLGQYETALAFAQQHAEQYRFAVGAHRTLAVLHRHLGNDERAAFQEEWTIALGGRVGVLADRVHRAIRTSRFEKAIEIAREALSAPAGPHTELLELNYALALSAKGRAADAADVLRASMDRVGTDSTLSTYNQKQRDVLLSTAARAASMEHRKEEILRGEATPTTGEEAYVFADICNSNDRALQAARYFRAVFELTPDADHSGYTSTYAMNSALDGARVANAGDPAVWIELSKCALGQAHRALAASRRRIAAEDPSVAGLGRSHLRAWLGDGTVRARYDEVEKRGLPDEQVVAWRAFWSDVDELFAELFGSPR